MTPAKQYAVLVKGTWHICQLVLATEYTPPNDDTHWTEPPVWSEIPTTAYVCKFDEADHVIPLKEPV